MRPAVINEDSWLLLAAILCALGSKCVPVSGAIDSCDLCLVGQYRQLRRVLTQCYLCAERCLYQTQMGSSDLLCMCDVTTHTPIVQANVFALRVRKALKQPSMEVLVALNVRMVIGKLMWVALICDACLAGYVFQELWVNPPAQPCASRQLLQ